MLKFLTGSGPCPCCAYSQATTAFPFARRPAPAPGARFSSSGSTAAANPPALFLDGGTVIYSLPKSGPLADSTYVLPGSVRANEADLKAIVENLSAGTKVYFY